MKHLELGLTEQERYQRNAYRKARNCGLAMCLLLFAVGLLIDLNK